jgi:hypothetical protein
VNLVSDELIAELGVVAAQAEGKERRKRIGDRLEAGGDVHGGNVQLLDQP